MDFLVGVGIVVAILIVGIHLMWVVYCQLYRHGKGLGFQKRAPFKTLFVLGSGGHTSELVKLKKTMFSETYSPRVYVAAHSDPFSFDWIKEVETTDLENVSYETVYRVREVGQSWISTILYSLPLSLIQSLYVYLKHRPYVILSNGPGICVPFMVIARVLKMLKLCECQIIYVESVCRVDSLSLSGRLALTFADLILVQWEDLLKRFKGNPKVGFLGRLT